MTWARLHAASQALALEADQARRSRAFGTATELYRQAADSESQALLLLDPGKARTFGATAVSAVALWFKAAEYERAEQLAHSLLGGSDLPKFARHDLRDLVQAIWIESAKREAGVEFVPGEVLVSVQGGQVVTGGAPLDLIMDKVQTIQAIFYRTVEFMTGVAHRRSGRPIKEIQDACRPWLFQSVPGSYQFSVAIQRPQQSDLFREDFAPEEVAQRFLEIVDASRDPGGDALEIIVPDDQYRGTFQKLARNLAPTGKAFERLEISSTTVPKSVKLGIEDRAAINTGLRARASGTELSSESQESLVGVLRAVHLDKDWLELIVDGESVHIDGLEDTADDIVGPMVNRQVTVLAIRGRKGKYRFRDIELVE